jgi:hypothetical protein
MNAQDLEWHILSMNLMAALTESKPHFHFYNLVHGNDCSIRIPNSNCLLLVFIF